MSYSWNTKRTPPIAHWQSDKCKSRHAIYPHVVVIKGMHVSSHTLHPANMRNCVSVFKKETKMKSVTGCFRWEMWPSAKLLQFWTESGEKLMSAHSLWAYRNGDRDNQGREDSCHLSNWEQSWVPAYTRQCDLCIATLSDSKWKPVLEHVN